MRVPADFDYWGLFHAVDERIPVDSLAFGARVFKQCSGVFPGWPIHITWAAMALSLMAWGPGKASVDHLLTKFLTV